MQLSRSKIKSLDLKELGEYYEVPGWLWENVPIRACGCLKSTLTDMVTYACASLQGANDTPQDYPSSNPDSYLSQWLGMELSSSIACAGIAQACLGTPNPVHACCAKGMHRKRTYRYP